MSDPLPGGDSMSADATSGDGGAGRTPLVGGNPGWAGERGDFAHLTEAEIRGDGYVGRRALDGGVGGAVASMPYQLAAKDPDAPLFEGPYAERLEKIRARYPDARGALLPVLNMAEEVRGHLSPEAMERVAEVLGLAPAYVRGVATFYTMYNRQPVGRFFVQVCTNVACNLCGGDEVMEAFLEHLDVESGVTTPDGNFTVMEAECLAACGFPVAVQINSRYFENVTPEDVPAIIAALASGEDSADAADGSDGGAAPAPGAARPRTRAEATESEA